MINNINILPLYQMNGLEPFFDKCRSIAYCQQYQLYTEMNTILPFQIDLGGLGYTLDSIELRKSDGTVAKQDILADMISSGLVIVQNTAGTSDLLLYRAMTPMPLNILEDYYYIIITVEGPNSSFKNFNSEIFHMMPNLDKFIKLEYFANDEIESPFGSFNFEFPFRFKIFINADIGRPSYKFTNEEINRDSIVFYRKQLSSKIFKFAFIAPEYICDALRLAPLCENKKLTDQYGNEFYLKQMKLDISFNDGYFAQIKCEFSVDDVIKRTPSRYPQKSFEDYNIDYNNDYNSTI